jgi:hypothetical protein
MNGEQGVAVTRDTPVHTPLKKSKCFAKGQWREGSKAVHLENTQWPRQRAATHNRYVKVGKTISVRQHLILGIECCQSLGNDGYGTSDSKTKGR